MRFSTIIKALAFAAGASANSIHFENLDSIPKTIYFTPNPNSVGMAPTTLRLGAYESATWTSAGAWEGNYYSVNDGAANVPGMLGEVNFSAANTVYYDVSAIVNPNDNSGVKELWGGKGDPVSGCPSYETTCANAYNLPDDVQTKATYSGTRELYCSVGNGASAYTASLAAREVESPVTVARRHARDFVRMVKNAL